MLLKLLMIAAIAGSILASTSVSANTEKNTNGTKVTKQVMQESDALSLIAALNNNEINLAKEALKKTDNSAVKDYATMMMKQHEQNLDTTLKIAKDMNIPLNDTAAVKAMKERGMKKLKQLDGMQGKEFDKEYMNDMVNGHDKALSLVDKLIKRVTNAQVKEHLVATQTAIKHHLEEAKDIQKSLS